MMTENGGPALAPLACPTQPPCVAKHLPERKRGSGKGERKRIDCATYARRTATPPAPIMNPLETYRCGDFPKEHPVLGPLAPSAEAVARALAGRDRTRLQPAGAYAANALGLSDQVPAKAIFLTDGPARTVKIGPTPIQLRRTTPKNMEAAGRLSGLLIQALRELGQENTTRERRDHLKRTLAANERQELIKDNAN